MAYASRTQSELERKASSTYGLECLAVVFGTEKFRKYIEHKYFILETDKQARLLSHPLQLGQIGRLVVKISALKYEVRHVRGTQNLVAGTLSRMLDSHTSDSANPIESHLVLTEFLLAFQELGQLQQEEPTLAGIVAQMEKGDIFYSYSLSKGILYCRPKKSGLPKLVVPTAAIVMVFAYFNESLRPQAK